MTTFSKSIFRSPARTLSMAAVTSLLCLSSSFSIQAETVELKNGDILSGDINSLDKDRVALNSPLASNALEIKTESIDRIVFPDQDKDTPTHTERLILTNSDVIPCNVISMDDKNLLISTWYAGKFSIPRTSIHSLQFGISEDESIYKGQDGLSQWSTREGNWTLSDSNYSCRGAGTIARKLDLARNVRFNFDLSWKEKPNFVFRFCAENDASMTRQDTYELLFNSAGMQIRRFENSKQPGVPLADIPIKPHSVSEQSLHIDLRVNRGSKLITLFINGKEEGTWPDPFAESKGNYIILNSRSSKDGTCMISNLQVSSINDGSLPRHREKNITTKTDVLLDSEGEKISGSITSISEAEPNKRKITFAANYSANPIQVPDRRISTLFFAQSEKDVPPSPTTFTAMLAGNGAIQLENPILKNDQMLCQHPILGSFNINIKALAHIKQSNAEATAQKAN